MMRSADTPTTREVARRLLAYEEIETRKALADTPAVSLVCDKLRRPLTTMVGAAGFRSLLMRALTLAKYESPALDSLRIGQDGSLDVSDFEAEQSGGVLVAHLLGLMHTFIGETLTLRLLHDAWPDLPESDLKIERDQSI